MIYNYVFMLALFHNKKCYNCINLFSCILWDFIVLGLVLSWWRIKHAKKVNAVLRLPREKLASKGTHEKATWEAHSESWRVKCQAAFREYLTRKAILRGTHETFCLEDFKCDFLTFTHTIYTLITHKSKRDYSKKNPREVSTTHPPFLEKATHP